MAKKKHLSRGEQRELKAELRVLLGQGVPDQELADDLGVSQRQLRQLLGELLNDEVTAVAGDTAGQAFVRYKIRMDGSVLDLDDVIKRGKEDPKSFAAVVAAVKVKTAILDAIDAKGQKLGLIPSAPVPGEELDGVPIDQLTSEDLADQKRDKIRVLAEYMGGDSGGNYADEEDESIYQEELSHGRGTG